jgi:hypothetical protein
MRHALSPLALALTVLLCGACDEKQPARLTLDPSGPFKLSRAGASETLRVTAWTDRDLPFTAPIEVRWDSSDDSVATVTPAGVMTTASSGDARITARSGVLSVAADVQVRIVGSVEIEPGTPSTFRIGKGEHKLEVTVKDDRGQVMDPQPQVTFSVSNYCIDMDPDGTFRPVSLGKCDAIAKVAGQSAKVTVEVK